MRHFIMLWCAYDPDNYMGHRVHILEAKELAEAKAEARAFLDKHWARANWEFRVIEVCGHDSGSRLWDTRDPPKRPNENQYTIDNYWEAGD